MTDWNPKITQAQLDELHTSLTDANRGVDALIAENAELKASLKKLHDAASRVANCALDCERIAKDDQCSTWLRELHMALDAAYDVE